MWYEGLADQGDADALRQGYDPDGDTVAGDNQKSRPIDAAQLQAFIEKQIQEIGDDDEEYLETGLSDSSLFYEGMETAFRIVLSYLYDKES